jgi:hypothetical protein
LPVLRVFIHNLVDLLTRSRGGWIPLTSIWSLASMDGVCGYTFLDGLASASNTHTLILLQNGKLAFGVDALATGFGENCVGATPL